MRIPSMFQSLGHGWYMCVTISCDVYPEKPWKGLRSFKHVLMVYRLYSIFFSTPFCPFCFGFAGEEGLFSFLSQLLWLYYGKG